MIRRCRLFLGLTLAAVAAPLWPQAPATGDEVAARSVAALGGEGAWEAIRSLELAGTQTNYSVSRPFRIYRQRPNLYRFEHYYAKHPALVAYDGEMAWWHLTVEVATKGAWPVAAPLPYAGSIAADAEFDVPFLSYQARGHQLAFRGLVDFEGESCYELEVTLGGGQSERWYVDAESFLPYARVSTIFYVWLPLERRTYFSDYQESGGVMVPRLIEHEFGNEQQILEIDEVRINPEIDPRVFELPPPAGMEKLRRLAGSFEVEVESRLELPVPEAPRLRTTGTATLEADFDHALVSENIELVAAEFPLRVRRLYTYDRFRDVFRIAHFDNATAHLEVLEGVFEDGRLVVSNLETKTARKSYRNTHHTRMSFDRITDRGFVLEVETSSDGGQTWTLERRLTYTRTDR